MNNRRCQFNFNIVDISKFFMLLDVHIILMLKFLYELDIINKYANNNIIKLQKIAFIKNAN